MFSYYNQLLELKNAGKIIKKLVKIPKATDRVPICLRLAVATHIVEVKVQATVPGIRCI